MNVTDNVYTYEDFHSGAEKFTTNSLIVVTPEGVLMADAQGSAAATKGLVDAIATLTPAPITFVVIGSDHGDHTGGNVSLPASARYVIHPTSKEILDRAAAARPGSWKLPAEADIVTGKKSLTLGSVSVEVLFLGRSHTGGDLAVYLPRQKILFMSEIFLNRVFPAMRSAYPTEWLAAVDKALAMPIERRHKVAVVPLPPMQRYVVKRGPGDPNPPPPPTPIQRKLKVASPPPPPPPVPVKKGRGGE